LTTLDYINVAVTMLGVFAMLMLGRWARRRYTFPKLTHLQAYFGYNAIVVSLLGALYLGGLSLPAWAFPVALVGGNAILAEVYGLPKLGGPRRRKPKKGAATAAADLARQKIVPEAKKKRHKRRR
jgi:hypothetical protein